MYKKKMNLGSQHLESSFSMTSIIIAVFKATIGLLVNKGRDKAAEELKDSDVTDRQFRGLIVGELDDIKSKLDGLSRKYLLASISFFKEGIEFLYEVFDKASSRSECGAVTALATVSAVSVAESGMRKLDLTRGLVDSATRALSNAKERFKDARRKATEAFNNEALKLSDRILAMQYRVMATILETLDNPGDALAACKVCIEELHSLPAVHKCFDVQFKKGFWARFSKDDKHKRREIISSVCHVNRVLYDVTLMVGRGEPVLMNYFVNCLEEIVDPLRDGRITQVLHEVGMEHCCVIWSFGQGGEEEHKLKNPWDIATNSQGHFIIADMLDRNIKMFENSGKFLYAFCPLPQIHPHLCICDVATDMNDNIYVLVNPMPCKPGLSEDILYVFDNAGKLHHKFPLLPGNQYYRLSVNMVSGKVLLLGRPGMVDLYEAEGQFVRRFGEGILMFAEDITAANDGRVMVVEVFSDKLVHVFTEQGDHLNKFKVNHLYSYFSYRSHRIAFHWASEHVVVVAEGCLNSIYSVQVQIYTKDGERLRSINVDNELVRNFRGFTVTMEGRIAITFQVDIDKGKVLIV